jgi:hypothetical protein
MLMHHPSNYSLQTLQYSHSMKQHLGQDHGMSCCYSFGIFQLQIDVFTLLPL